MNFYLPQKTIITQIKNLTPDTKLFRLDLKNYKFLPGQFIMLSVLGYGEAPFSITSSPTKKKYIDLTVRKVGCLTKAVFDKKVGDEIYIRGPYGNGFPLPMIKGKNLIVIAGGCGLAPMRSIIDYHIDNKNFFSNLQILYGARSPQDILYQNEMTTWQKKAEVIVTVDKPDKSWRGNSGLITNLINSKIIDAKNSAVIICGPPIMYENVIKKLLESGFLDTDIFVSLERNMQCGVGICQHCTCGDKYVCTDGPVFSYNQIKYLSYKRD